ncbi:DUF2442 domain-containing protein [Sphingobium sp.]|uniref:DUF2442 domain-containing protein n=1 Tax=Sphingobium sp. TaxID=1912891 RepID=UPI0026013AC1|nr:DUF2442 domain-containing protein [Sphingobium sp.]
MSITDKMRTISAVHATGATTLHISWSDGTEADLDLAGLMADRAFATLRDQAEFARVEIGDWGHGLAWPSGAELGADRLWLETLAATGHDDARTFLEWRMRHGLSLSKAAEALGVSRRMVAYYSNGEKVVPKPVLLACKGWEVSEGLRAA